MTGVQHILRGGRHLLGLIDDVLEISKIESNHLDLSLEPVLVATLLSETVQLMIPQALSSGVTLRFEPSTVARYRVQADQRRLRQVLINVLSNAVKYNRRGGRVAVHCRPVMSESGPDARLDIDVVDTGQGHPGAGSATTVHAVRPLGRGIDGHRGQRGRFGVVTPLDDTDGRHVDGDVRARCRQHLHPFMPLISQQGEEPAAAGLAVDMSPPGESSRTRTLLYIEDNSSNVELMKQLIRRRPGWQMLVAGDGELGVELATTAGIELVLLDLHLPGMTGIEVLRTLRADHTTRHREIVVISADASPRQQERLRDAGAHTYLTKPIDVAKVLALLDRPPRGD